jgi:hypothetical protein
MSAASVEYVFITTAALFRDADGEVTAALPSVRLGSIGPTYALARLGYDARTVSVFRDTELAEASLAKAKRIVFGEMSDAAEGWITSATLYRKLLERIDDRRGRVVFSIADDHFEDRDFLSFYREALPECLAVTAVSERLAATVRDLTERPVYVVPEPAEGVRRPPHAPTTRRPSRWLLWLAEHAGVPGDAWRVRLLWYGYPMNLHVLLDMLPELERFSTVYPLELTCITNPVAEIEQLLTPERTRGDARLRARFIPWTFGAVENALAASDFVLIPSQYGDLRRQAKSPNRLVSALHGGRLPICHPLPAYAPYAGFAWVGENLVEGLRWALENPRKVVERIAAGQGYIEERHSPEAVARAWLNVFRTSA